jgi:hypothetical protein
MAMMKVSILKVMMRIMITEKTMNMKKETMNMKKTMTTEMKTMAMVEKRVIMEEVMKKTTIMEVGTMAMMKTRGTMKTMAMEGKKVAIAPKNLVGRRVSTMEAALTMTMKVAMMTLTMAMEAAIAVEAIMETRLLIVCQRRDQLMK